jgi:uncharacterized protein YdhG (YjbR/CyaY superfamily)
MNTAQSVDDYIHSFPVLVQKLLHKVRDVIHSAAPDAQEKMSYGIPTFTLKGKNLVHFAAYKKHIGFYPGPQAIIDFSDQLTAYKTSKGAIQFPLDKPIPYDLISEITQSRSKDMLNPIKD